MSVINLNNGDDVYVDPLGQSNSINGLAGDDVIAGRDGNDIIDGGTGFDTADYSSTSSVTGIAGVIVNLATGKATDEFGDHDTLINIEAVRGTLLNDKLTGGNTANDVSGEYFYGLEGADTISGGTGYDEVRYDKDAQFGGMAGVTVNLAKGTAIDGFGTKDKLIGIEAVRGTQFDDTLIGGNKANDGYGEYFYGLKGADTIDGGTGYDEVRYDKDVQFGGKSGVTVNLGLGTATDGFGTTDTLRNIESVRGTQFNDTLTGSDATTRSFESLDGLAGNDTLNGGGGLDEARYDKDAQFGATHGVTVNLAKGVATDGFGTTDTLISIEVVRGTNFADTLTGGNAASATYEGFYGLGGADKIAGGAGFDEVRYDKDAANGGTQGIVANLTTHTVTDGFGDIDSISGIEAVVGTDSADSMTGDANANRFSGHGGNDTIDGKAGIDTIDFRFDDLFGATHGTTVDLAAGTVADPYGGQDTLTSIENVLGSVFADTITGSKVANVLSGDAGNDRLDGGLGSDTLTGGLGADTFHFSTKFGAANVDHISDFEKADTVEIVQALVPVLPVGTLAASAFKDLSLAAEDANDRILYDRASGTLSYDSDGTGTAAAVTFAVLDHPIALTSADFHIV